MRSSRFFFIAAGLLLGSRTAGAYPQWQFSSGTSRCSQCHFSPAGGGLINNYGRSAAGEDLSTWEGDGGFLHGVVELPSWLALGYDGRLAFLRHEAGNSEGPKNALFPMQADAQVRVAGGGFSALATVGFRGQARTAPEKLAPDNPKPSAASRVISREHYLMWRPAALGPYVRAGRFFAPYGLRLAEHTTYVRRDLGFNLLEESYGLSAGILKNEWEIHATGFVPDGLRDMGGRDTGFALMAERRVAGLAALGLSARVGYYKDARRFQGGPFARAYIEKIKTQLMFEADVVNGKGATGPAANQLAGYLGATVFPVKGLWLSVYGERLQTDIKVKGTATDALNGQINWFPYPHLEVALTGRLQSPQGQESARTLLFQLHYYL